ncbi:unnamed protein product [Rotaria sp. Silwood2]|nr:unnamed protein product [Rotaria sp. Silwood2]
MTIKNSNEELNDVQRQLLLTIEKKNNKISSMNNRIRELQQNLIEIEQHIDKIQTKINNYQQISIEHLTEIGTIKIAIESMFDLVPGEDDISYTIQMISINESNTSQPRNSISPNRSSISMISNNKGRKSSTFRTSISKLRKSIDIQLRSLTTQSTRTNFKLTNEQYNNDKILFI